MTNIPLFHSFSLQTDLSGKSAVFYPLVGLLLGLILWAVSIPLGLVFPEKLLPYLLFGIYTLSYGALHTDGFADTTDALLSYKGPEEAAKILKDPNIGAQGAVYLVIFILIKAVSFAQVSVWDFIAIPMLARYGIVIAIFRFPYLKWGNMGRSQHEQFTKKDFIVSSLSLFLILPFTGFNAFILLPAALILPLIMGKWITGRLSGLNGDSYGFITETSELLLLLLTTVALQ